MPYPDGTNFAALDRETSSRRTVARRDLTADEMTVISLAQCIAAEIDRLCIAAGRLDLRGTNGRDYVESIREGIYYCDNLRSEIQSFPARDAEAEERECAP